MKKLNKFFAVLVALAMMATLCVSMAFATGANEPAGDLATAATNSKLVKYLKMPNGVTVPNETFKFKFDAKTEGAPAVSAQIPASSLTYETAYDKDEGGIYGYLTIAQIFENKDKAFPHAGLYEYVVTEEKGSNTNITYDETDSYVLRVYVDKDGNITNVVVIDGEYTEGTVTGDKTNSSKTDPTEGKTTEVNVGDPDIGFTFINTYDAEDIIRPETSPALTLTKNVAGTYGSTTAKFPFQVKLVNANYTGDKTIPGKAANEEVSFELGTAQTVYLANGESLVFTNVPAGTTYEIEELLETSQVENKANYKATGVATGVAATPTTPDKGKDIVINSTAAIQDDAVASVVTVTNTADELPPEGILIPNLPYIALALVAIGGLVAYVVVRRRNADEA